MNTHFIIDGHLDMAYNALTHRRDYRNSALRTRTLEHGAAHVKSSGECTVGFPDLLRGRVGLVFGTIFVEPKSHQISYEQQGYSTPEEAHALGMSQLDFYHRLADEEPRITLVHDQRTLDTVLAQWQVNGTTRAPNSRRQIGIVPLMEGADPIREPKELELWYEKGLRIVGPAWDTTRYAGGTWQKGRLTKLGHELLDMMASLNVVLDVAHLSHESLYEALDAFQGKHVIASHCNAARFVPNRAERHLPDRAIEQLIERGAVIGVVLYNAFLKKDWSGNKRDVTLDNVVRMIDHVCQIAGNANHIGIGSDYDGGLGYNEIPQELNTVRDHHKIADELLTRGYAQADVDKFTHGNWLRMLRSALP